MTKCSNCKWNYPDEYTNRMFADGGYTEPICGICALELTNKIHGVQRTKFNGVMAEQARLDAIAWRRVRPGNSP